MLFESFYFQPWSPLAERNSLNNLVEDLPKNYPIKFGWNPPSGYRGDVVWSVVFFSIFSSGGHFVQLSTKIWAILVEDLPRNNPIKFGWNLPSSYGGVSFEVYTNFSSGGHFVQWSGRIWAILVKNLQRNNPIVWLKFFQGLQRRCYQVFFSIFSSGSHFVQWCITIWAILVGDLPRNNPIMFDWNPPSSYCLFLALEAILCSGAVWAILVENLSRNNPIKFDWNPPSGYGGDVVWSFFSIFSSGGHFVQWSGMIWVILVEGLQRNNPINFGWNLPSSYWGDVIWSKLWKRNEAGRTQGDHNSSPQVRCAQVIIFFSNFSKKT